MEKDGRELTKLRAYISDSRWRFAKTYVESYPHEYTLLQVSGALH